MDHIGLFTKDLETLELVTPVIVNHWNTQKINSNKNLVLGIPDGDYLNLAKKDVLNQFVESTKKLENQFLFKRIKLVQNISKINHDLDQIILAELYRVHSKWYNEFRELYKPLSRKNIEIGKTISDKNMGDI